MYEDPSDWRMPDWFFGEHEQFSLHAPMAGWARPKRDEIIALRNLLALSPPELDVQKFLQEHRTLFQSFMRNGHGNWLFPQFKFGQYFIADFVYCEGSSAGPHYTLVELESPQAKPFLSNGQFSRTTRTAIDQIRDWRRFASNNLDLIRKPKSSGGHGLHLFRPRGSAKVVIGRRENSYPARYMELRNELHETEHIEILSFDTFLERIESRWQDYYVTAFGAEPLPQIPPP